MMLAGEDDPAPLFNLFLDLTIHHHVQVCHWAVVRMIANRVWTPPGPVVLSQAPAVAYLVSLPFMSPGSLQLPICAHPLLLLSSLHVHALLPSRLNSRYFMRPSQIQGSLHVLPHIDLTFRSLMLNGTLLYSLPYCHMIIA